MQVKRLLTAYFVFIVLQLFTLCQPSTARATLISYDFTFSPSFGPQPVGSFTYDNTPGTERFTQFFINVNPDGLNNSYLDFPASSLSRFLFEILDGPPSSFSPFVVFLFPFGENLWFVEGRYEFRFPNQFMPPTHAGTFTITE